MTPSGIESEPIRLVALCLNQLRHRVPNQYIYIYSPPIPPHVLKKFRGFPPGCSDSVGEFSGSDALEARLRCPDDVSGDMQEEEIPGGALSLHLLTTRTIVTTGIFLCKENFSC